MTHDVSDTSNRAEHKIFCIGLARTGTTSLHRALTDLGVASAPDSIELVALFDDPDADLESLRRYDAFSDNPVPFLVEQLDRRFPGSRYVHTHRPRDDWLDSMEWLFSEGMRRLNPDMRAVGDEIHRRVYGVDEFDRTRLGEIHDHHGRFVADHFAERGHDLLSLDVAELEWEPLCTHLGLAIPDRPFPHVNARSGRLVHRVRSAVGRSRAARRGRRAR